MLQIGSLFMALYVLFVAHGLNVNFHWCTEDSHVMSSFGDASVLCEHCMGHHHHDHLNPQEFEEHLNVVHFDAKCCCEDFDSEIGFTDAFTFSTEKALMICLPVCYIGATATVVEDETVPVVQSFSQEKIPYLLTGRLKTIFFSSLRLDPGVC